MQKDLKQAKSKDIFINFTTCAMQTQTKQPNRNVALMTTVTNDTCTLKRLAIWVNAV